MRGDRKRVRVGLRISLRFGFGLGLGLGLGLRLGLRLGLGLGFRLERRAPPPKVSPVSPYISRISPLYLAAHLLDALALGEGRKHEVRAVGLGLGLGPGLNPNPNPSPNPNLLARGAQKHASRNALTTTP